MNGNKLINNVDSNKTNRGNKKKELSTRSFLIKYRIIVNTCML